MKIDSKTIKDKLYQLKNMPINKLRYLKPYFYYFLKQKRTNSIRVLIFAQGRTGSTLLESLLCSTSYFEGGGEILGHKGTKIRYPYQYISGLANITPQNNFIFHLKIYHLTRDRKKKVEPAVFLNKLQKDGWKIIYLHRENKLNHVISNKVAEEREAYQKYDNLEERIQLYLKPVDLIKAIETRKQFDRSELKALSNIDFLKISYENDLQSADNQQNTINNILDFIGLEKRECHTRLKKVNQSSQKDIIKNYEEVISLLNEENLSEYIE